MPLTKEELLKPRFKVIVDYPSNVNKIGDVISINHAGTPDAEKLVCGWYEKYPDIFSRLQWWEEHKVEEMPEYVIAKPIFESDNIKYYKVSEWYMYKPPIDEAEMIGFTAPDGHTIGAHAVLPIDKSEYQQDL